MLQQWMLNKTTAIPQPKLHQSTTILPSIPHTAPASQQEAKEQLSSPAVDSDALLLSLSRDVNYLNDEISTADRKAALTRIEQSLQQPLTAVTLATATALLTKPLLKRLTDAAEQCRLLACSVLRHLVTYCPLSTLLASLPYILPSVAFRLNCRDLTSAAQPYSAANTHTHYPPSAAANTAEVSEEVRLQLLQLTAAVVQRFGSGEAGGEFDLFLADVVTIIAQGVTDRSPPLKQAATTLLIALLATHSHQLRATSLLLARLLTPNLAHKHSRLRTLTLTALTRLLTTGSAAEHIRQLAAFTEHNVIDLHAFYHGETRCNYFALLCQDRNAAVREALYSLVGRCMTEMAEAADYETLLMPYLLTGLADESEASRTLCRGYVDKLAAQYRKDHLDDIEEAERYAPTTATAAVELSNFPYTGRPSMSLQRRLHVFVDRLFPALLSELGDWKVEVRSDSVRLMRTLLWLEEESVGAEWRAELLGTAVRIRQRDESSEERRRRDERGEEAESEVEVVWSEVMRLVARYGGEEVMRTLRRQREDGHEVGVLSLLPALLAGMEVGRVIEVAEEVEGWLEADRCAAVPSRAQLRRQLRVFAALVAALPSVSLAGVAVGLRELCDAAEACDSRELSRGAQQASALLISAQQKAVVPP